MSSSHVFKVVSKANVVDPRRPAKNNRVQPLPKCLSYNESLEFNIEGITGINDAHMHHDPGKKQSISESTGKPRIHN
jgi:hypothetical protein